MECIPYVKVCNVIGIFWVEDNTQNSQCRRPLTTELTLPCQSPGFASPKYDHLSFLHICSYSRHDPEPLENVQSPS